MVCYRGQNEFGNLFDVRYGFDITHCYSVQQHKYLPHGMNESNPFPKNIKHKQHFGLLHGLVSYIVCLRCLGRYFCCISAKKVFICSVHSRTQRLFMFFNFSNFLIKEQIQKVPKIVISKLQVRVNSIFELNNPENYTFSFLLRQCLKR